MVWNVANYCVITTRGQCDGTNLLRQLAVGTRIVSGYSGTLNIPLERKTEFQFCL